MQRAAQPTHEHEQRRRLIIIIVVPSVGRGRQLGEEWKWQDW